MTARSRTLHALILKAAARTGATYVSLFKERGSDPAVADPSMTAIDGVHPSDRGYQLAYDTLVQQGGLNLALRAARP